MNSIQHVSWYISRSTPIEPVYIRIPLKPPEGETDEFSYLEGENANESSITTEIKAEDRSDSLDTTSPSEVNKKDIQFIFLTPPSDDELLDKVKAWSSWIFWI